jgi:hypothetical protein
MAFTADFAHYNQIGAFFAYRELMKHINLHLPEIIPYELKDVDVKYDEKGRPLVSLKPKQAYQKLDSSFFDDVSYDNNQHLFNAAYENADPNLPVILLLRDSYAEEQFIGKYLAQHFGKTIMIHFVNMAHIEEYIIRFKPDIVVIEAAERQLEIFADCVSRIPELP